MKKVIALLLALSILALAGCNLQTKDPEPDAEPVKLTLTVIAAEEKVANVVRDQLKRAGIDLTVNVYVDHGTMVKAVDTGQYDLMMRSYSGAGSPDANVRGPLHSQGGWNDTGHNDPEIDRLIDLAASQSGDEALATYKELERLLVEGKALLIPLTSPLKTFAVNKDVVKGETIEASVGGARWVWSTDYNDPTLRDTRHYVLGLNWPNPNSFDCVQGRDGSTYYQRTNINAPLIQCAQGGVTTTRGSLSKSYTIAESNQDLYFLIRTDVNFGTYKGGKAVDTGLPVAAEDVKYTFERALSGLVPNSLGQSYLSFVETVNIVDNLDDLKNTASADGGSVFDALNKGIDKPFTALAADKYDANDNEGKYEVIHLHLKEKYPQQIVTLSAGQISIVCKERIEKVNAGITSENYDPTKHKLYGDPTTLTKNSDHGMYFSGPYVLNYVDDYGSYLERNPGWNPEAEDAAKIKYVDMLPIADNSTQTQAFRNGELDEAMPGGENIAVAEKEPHITLLKTPSVAVTSIFPILLGNSKMTDENLRKAVLYAINTKELIAVMGAENYVHAGSTMIMLNTGYQFEQDLAKSAEYLQKYRDSLTD